MTLWVQRVGWFSNTGGTNKPTLGHYILSGTQTVTAEIIDATIRLTPKVVYIKKATNLTFTASATDAPYVWAESWWFDPDSAGLADQGLGCGANACTFLATRSGYLNIKGRTSQTQTGSKGRLQIARARVIRYGSFQLVADKYSALVGDTVTFTPKVDGDSVIPTKWKWVGPDTSDRTADCAAMGTDAYSCKQRMRRPGTGTMWAYITNEDGKLDSASASVSVKSLLKFECTPVVVRGSAVECKTYLLPDQPFTISARQASGEGFTNLSKPGLTYSGGTDTWSGTAVTTTTVDIEVRLQDGQTLSASSSFNVVPRAWQSWALTQQPDSVSGIRGGMPRTFRRQTRFVAANYELRGLVANSVVTTSVTAGPDSGLSFVAALPPLNGAEIYFHPDLQAGTPFSRAQDGLPSGTCSQYGLSIYRSEVARHEGRTMAPNSHFGVTNRAFFEQQPHLLVERAITAMQPDAITQGQWLQGVVAQIFWDWRQGPHHNLQIQFDSTDYPVIANNTGCILDTSY